MKKKDVFQEAQDRVEAALPHKGTEHFKTWTVNVGDRMVRPRFGEKHQIIQPSDRVICQEILVLYVLPILSLE